MSDVRNESKLRGPTAPQRKVQRMAREAATQQESDWSTLPKEERRTLRRGARDQLRVKRVTKGNRSGEKPPGVG
jgi:hypothetical protein